MPHWCPTPHLSTAVVVVDQALCVRDLNPAAEDLFAVSARAATNRPLAALLPDSDALARRLRGSLADGQPWTARELPLTVAGGLQSITVDLTVNPAQGSRLVLEFAGLDRHLRISREEHLQAQHAASRALVRGLAHEIKNPLGGLRGAAQLLERKLDDPALREYTRVIVAEADRLAGLVDTMLGPARAPQRVPVSIHEVTERVATLIESEAPGIQVRRAYDPSLPPLYADPDQLVQALLNVARNAAQAQGGAGSVTLATRIERQVTVGGTRHRQAVCVDVIDAGPGVPPELAGQIFFPLVSSRADGSGLGLPIAQAIASRHRGLIESESRPGHTVFTLILPLEAEHE